MTGSNTSWTPPDFVSRDDVISAYDSVLGRPDIAFATREDVFRIRAADMDWDIGAMIYEPVDGAVVPGTVLTVTLSVDHRPVDGVDAARWMRAFIAVLERPAQILA